MISLMVLIEHAAEFYLLVFHFLLCVNFYIYSRLSQGTHPKNASGRNGSLAGQIRLGNTEILLLLLLKITMHICKLNILKVLHLKNYVDLGKPNCSFPVWCGKYSMQFLSNKVWRTHGKLYLSKLLDKSSKFISF